MAKLISKTIRYSIAVACVGLVFFWNAKEPPLLDINQMQVTEGVYKCSWQEGGKRGGPSGPDVVDGVIYYDHFSYLFGLHAPRACFRELTGHKVRISFLNPTNLQQRLTLEIFDIKSGRIFGVTKEQKFVFYKEQVKSKWIFYLCKFGLLLLALRVTFWDRLKTLFQQSFNRIKNHGVNR